MTSTISIKYLDEGTRVRAMRLDEDSIKSELNPEVYTVGFNPMEGFYLNKLGKKLETPTEIYGKTRDRIEKVITSYKDSERSFGVLFSGDKGSGKTMQAMLIAQRALDELNLPVIMVDDSFDASGLADFMQLLGECVFLFDEFGKRFGGGRESAQNGFLGLFDGATSSRRLLLLTENNARQINEFMLNRPGRIHYHFRHEKLDEDIIRELCQARNIPEDVVEKICLIRESSLEFSFDSLQAIVREYTRFPSNDVTALAADLNIEQPSAFGRSLIEVVEVVDLDTNKKLEVVRINDNQFPTAHTSPYVVAEIPEESDDADGEPSIDHAEFYLSIRSIVKRDGDTFTFIVEDDRTYKVVAKRKEWKYDYSAF